MPNSLPQQPIALVVEDEPELQEIYRTVLEAEGWEVRVADNGERALHLFESNRVQMMVVDFLLPKLDGVRFIEETAKIRKTPTIFASAVMRDEVTKRRLQSLGVQWFLEKPFRLTTLRKTIHEIQNLYLNKALA